MTPPPVDVPVRVVTHPLPRRDSREGARIARPSGHGQATPSIPGVPAVSDSAFLPLVVPRVGDTPVDVRDAEERARARGYADGFAEGRRIALDQAQEQQRAEQRRMQDLIDSYLHQRGSLLSALQAAHSNLEDRVRDVGDLAAERIEALALELASVVLGAELSDPARSAAHALNRALAEMPLDRWTRVQLNPRDHETLEADAGAGLILRGIEVASSSAVDPGGALIEIEDGAVDTRIGQAFARVAAVLDDGQGGDGDGGDSQLDPIREVSG